MAENRAHLVLRIELQDPIELTDFSDLFASIASQYEHYIKKEYPKTPPGEARIFLEKIEEGSILASLFPGGPGDLIKLMDDVLIVVGFGKLMAYVIDSYVSGKQVTGAKKSDLKAYLDTVKAIGKDPNGSATLETAVWENGMFNKKVAFSFTSKQARQMTAAIENHKKELDASTHADHDRVVMYFKRPDSGDAAVGKRSGERVVIERISDRDLPLVYASDIAEQQIKHELRTATDNIFNLGFVVDVNVETREGKPVAYAVKAFHQVIEP